MRNTTPIGEINVDQIMENAKRSEAKLLEKRKNLFNEKIQELNGLSLSSLANNSEGYLDKYKPYILDFGIVLNKIKGDFVVDMNNESLQIKIDIINQLKKMKNVPSFSTECHIESNDIKRCTTLRSLILKKLFRQKKYRLIFHNREATFNKKYYNKLDIKMRLIFLALAEIAMFIASIITGSNFLFNFSLVLMIINLLLFI